MTFNKIKELANSVDELQKAIESSEMLELSDDKQSVRRTTEIKKKDDLDEYMVYVVCLQQHGTSFLFYTFLCKSNVFLYSWILGSASCDRNTRIHQTSIQAIR